MSPESTVPSPLPSPAQLDTLSVRVAVAEPAALVALITTLVVAAVMGVPLMRPVVVFTPSPLGSPVASKDVGVPDAVIWYAKALSTKAVAVVALVIAGSVPLPPPPVPPPPPPPLADPLMLRLVGCRPAGVKLAEHPTVIEAPAAMVPFQLALVTTKWLPTRLVMVPFHRSPMVAPQSNSSVQPLIGCVVSLVMVKVPLPPPYHWLAKPKLAVAANEGAAASSSETMTSRMRFMSRIPMRGGGVQRHHRR